MCERPDKVKCGECGVEMPVGKRGPIPQTCDGCRRLPDAISRLFRVVAEVRDKRDPLGQAMLRRKVMSAVMSELNATFNTHKFKHGKVTDAATRRAQVEAERAAMRAAKARRLERWRAAGRALDHAEALNVAA